jgi:replication-associated recombination protein RarA
MKSMDEEEQAVGVGPWNMFTRDGYRCDEVVSALQKSIRRGDSDGALTWAHQLNVSGYGAWVWRRLFIIVSEDIGLAEPTAPAVIAGLWTASQVLLANQRKPAPGEKVQYPWLEVLQATAYLARCPKNRELADLCGVLEYRIQRGEMPQIPDVAKDMHTAAGRAMGRGAIHFEDQSPDGGRWCKDEIEIDGNRYRKEVYRLWKVPDDPSSRVYRAIDPAPVDPSTEPSSN